MTSLDNIPIESSATSDGIGWDSHMHQNHRPYRDNDVYVRDGVYNGIKVDSQYKDRMIPKDADLSEIFTPVSDISVYCLDIFPGSEDIQIYTDILKDVYNRDAFIESEDKHPTDKGFVVMLVVNHARMVFRKESYNNIYPKIGDVQ